MKGIVRVDFVAVPQRDLVLPPLTSKVVKELVLSGKLLPSLSGLVKSREKDKPVFVSNLGLNGRRLYSSGRAISVRAGDRLDFFVSFPHYDDFLSELWSGTFATSYGEFYVDITEVKVVDLDELSKVDPGGKAFLVEFVTPTLFSSKVLLPPRLKGKYKGIKPGYSLIPSVGLILAYAYKAYSSLLGKRAREEVTYRLGVLGNALSRVISYDLRPVTVVIGRDGRGNLREARGFVGWLEFDIADVNLKKRAAKYLLTSSFLGLGKSRGIGLGEVKVELK